MNKIHLYSCLALMVACGNPAKKDNMKEETTDKGLDLSAMDTSVRPQDDFYNYVNGGWMKTAKIPADKPSWGTFYMLREETDQQCLSLLDNLLKTSYPDGSDGQKIQAIYKTYMDMDARNKAGLEPLQPYLKKIEAIKTLADLQAYLEEATPLGENPVCGWGVYADMKDSNQNAVYLSNFGLGLGRDYYQKQSQSNTEAISKYQIFVADIFKLLGDAAADEKAQKQVAFEKDLAKLMLTNEEDRDPNLSYNPQTMEELSKLVKNLNIPALLKKVGVNTDKVIVGEIRLYKEYDKFINEKNLPLLKDYLRYQLVTSNAGYLNAAPYEQLIQIDEIGDRIAQSVIEFFADDRNKEILERLQGYGLQFALKETAQTSLSEALKGKTLVVSGVFARHSRDEIKALIESHGGKVGSSISSKTNYVVAGENMGPSKLEKATQLGIPILSEEEFEKMIQ